MANISNIKKLLGACICIIGVACSKSSSSPQTEPKPESPVNQAEAKLYPVNLRVGDLEVSTGRMSSKEMPVKEYLRYIFYGAYDSTGKLASKIVQDYVYGGFPDDLGVLKDSLPAGNYTVEIAGSNYPCYGGDGDSSINSLSLSPGYYEIFHKKFSISVGERDTATTTVKLSRITGELDLQLTDTLPAIVKYINVTVENMPYKFYPATNLFDFYEAQNFTSNYHQDNNLVSQSYFFGSNLPHRISITAEDGGSPVTRVLYRKIIDNIYVYPNKKTVLRGSLSSSSTTPDPNSAISVTIDPDYEETITQDF